MARSGVTRAVDAGCKHRGQLVRAQVVKDQALADVFGRAQAQQRGPGAYLHEVAEGVAHPRNLGAGGLDVGVGQHRAHQVPGALVVGRARQAHTEVVVAVRPVEFVEPVAGVVAVAVQALAAQGVHAGMEVGRALGQRHGGHAQQLHPRAVFLAGGRWHLHRVHVEERLVVVVLDVVHHLAGLGGVAHAAQVLQLHGGVPVGRQRVVGNAACQCTLDEVAIPAQVVQRARAGARVGVVPQAVDEALVADELAAAVAAATAAHGVAHLVAEGADAAARQAALRGLRKARAVDHLTEVPALAEEMHLAPGGAVHARLQLLHHRTRLVAHEVEAETGDLVFLGPEHGRVDHQLAHHQVLGGRVVAAAAVGHGAAGVQALVVAGHHAVEHALGVLAAGGRVVVDHVHAHAQAGRVQAHHHLAELDDASGAVGRVAGVAALGGVEVPRVIAPVEAVGSGAGGHRCLLGFSVRGTAGCRRGAARLGHAGDVEHRQQVHVGNPRIGDGLEVLHAVAAGFAEGQVLAAVGGADRAVAGAEIAHVQLVDHHVGCGLHPGRHAAGVPARGLQRRSGEVGDVAACAVGGEAHAVGVGDEVAHQSRAAHEHFHGVAVVPAGEVAGALRSPHAGGGVHAHFVDRDGCTGGGVVGVGINLLRRGCPKLEARVAASHGDAQVGRIGGRCVQVVQRRGVLRGGGVLHLAGGVFLHQHQLGLVQVDQARQVGVLYGEHRTHVDPLETFGRHGWHAAGEPVERDRAIRATHRAVQRRDDLAGGRVIELHRAGTVHARPLDELFVEPESARVARAGAARVGLADVHRGVALHQPDLAHAGRDGQCRVVDADVVVAAVLVVALGREAVDDEFQRAAAGIALRVQHRDVEHHLGGAGAAGHVTRHGAERHRRRPLVDGDAGGQARGVDAVAGPQVQAPGRVVAAEALVVHAHGVDVGRAGALRVAGVGDGVALDAPDLVLAGLKRVALIDAGMVFFVTLVEDVAHAAALRGQRHLVHLPEGGGAAGGEAGRPLRFNGSVEGVQGPARVVARRAAVVHGQRGGRAAGCRCAGRRVGRLHVQHGGKAGVAVGQANIGRRCHRRRGRGRGRCPAVTTAASGHQQDSCQGRAELQAAA